MASEADNAYQGSLVLLSSLSHLMKTDIGSFEVRALCLWDQEIPFCSPLRPPCYPASSSAFPRAPSPLESHWISIFPPFCPCSWLRHKKQETSIRRCLPWFPASAGEMLGPPASHRISVSGGSNPAEAGCQCSSEPGGHLHGTVQAAAEPHGALGGRNQAAAAKGRGRESGKRLAGALRLELSSA